MRDYAWEIEKQKEKTLEGDKYRYEKKLLGLDETGALCKSLSDVDTISDNQNKMTAVSGGYSYKPIDLMGEYSEQMKALRNNGLEVNDNKFEKKILGLDE